jgi:hypothetical protein
MRGLGQGNRVNDEQSLLRVMAGLDPAILLLGPACSCRIGF